MPDRAGHSERRRRGHKSNAAVEMTLLWKSQNDSHKELGNLAQEREIPTFPQAISLFS